MENTKDNSDEFKAVRSELKEAYKTFTAVVNTLNNIKEKSWLCLQEDLDVFTVAEIKDQTELLNKLSNTLADVKF